MMTQPSLDERGGPTIPTERIGLVVEHLMHGQRLTTRRIADLTGVSPEGARLMLIKLSRLLPIRYDYDDQTWLYERRS